MNIKSSKRIYLREIPIGGGAPVMVQSMTNTDTRDVESTQAQINRLIARGCEAVRVAVPDMVAVDAFKKLLQNSACPLIADIHFDHRLAIAAADSGAAGIRINPGNIGSLDKINNIIAAAKANKCIIRIGVNSGSLEKDLLGNYGRPAAGALVDSAMRHIAHMEKMGFYDLKISLKSSSVIDTIEAYRGIRALCDYPLHIGVTEAGTLLRGAIKSAVGLGILLHEGIGDTIRVSLTAPPEEEVTAAYEILRALGIRKRGPEIISCPTCGRTEIDLFSLADAVEKSLAGSDANIKVAVMGCVVNGPGEAREADIGIAGGRDRGIIFRKGKVIKSVNGQDMLLKTFLQELEKLLADPGSAEIKKLEKPDNAF